MAPSFATSLVALFLTHLQEDTRPAAHDVHSRMRDPGGSGSGMGAPTFARAVVGSGGRGSWPPLRYRKRLAARGHLQNYGPHIVAAGHADAGALGRPVLLVCAPDPIDRV